MEKTTAMDARAVDKYTGIYFLKPCKKTWLEQFDKNHDGAYLFEGATLSMSPERDANTGLIKTGLSRQEQFELEKELGLKEGELSPYSKFWDNNRLYPKVPQDGLILNLERSPMDKVRYLYLRECSKVAQSESDALDNPQAELIMTSKEIEAKVGSKKIAAKVKAMKILAGMSVQEQMDFLKVYEGGLYKVDKSATADTVMSLIGKVADENSDAFILLLEDPLYKDRIFVQNCIKAGLIKTSGTRHFLNGGDQVGASFIDTVQNLAKPEYNEARLGLTAKLQELDKR